MATCFLHKRQQPWMRLERSLWKQRLISLLTLAKTFFSCCKCRILLWTWRLFTCRGRSVHFWNFRFELRQRRPWWYSQGFCVRGSNVASRWVGGRRQAAGVLGDCSSRRKRQHEPSWSHGLCWNMDFWQIIKFEDNQQTSSSSKQREIFGAHTASSFVTIIPVDSDLGVFGEELRPGITAQKCWETETMRAFAKMKQQRCRRLNCQLAMSQD